MSCRICCDDYNKSNRSKICCVYCDFDVCRSCCETYILSETIAKCMNPECAKEWSRKFLRENFTNVFLTSKYRQHLEDVLFDKEKALLPATQKLAEEKIRKNNIKKQINDLDLFIQDLHQQKRLLEQQLWTTPCMNGSETDKSHFVRQCPSNECRGFLSSVWKCGICEQWTCPECHELKGSKRDCEHTCNPNNVETAKLLAKDSKPCPKCQSLIFKINGCDQMWCTQCHTAFSWKTGKLESSIHNPHFYEWQRKNGGGVAPRNPGDLECGRELTQYTGGRIKTLATRHSDLCLHKQNEIFVRCGYADQYKHSEHIEQILLIIQRIIHNSHVELPNFQTDYVAKNQELRIRYLENSITEPDFKLLIQRNDKKNRKNNEIAQVLHLANMTVTDIVYRILDDLEKSENGKHHIISFWEEIHEIRRYCNDILKDISFTYNTTKYKFNKSFSFIRVEKEKNGKNEKKTLNEDNDDGL
jgi:hypothetical protein